MHAVTAHGSCAWVEQESVRACAIQPSEGSNLGYGNWSSSHWFIMHKYDWIMVSGPLLCPSCQHECSALMSNLMLHLMHLQFLHTSLAKPVTSFQSVNGDQRSSALVGWIYCLFEGYVSPIKEHITCTLHAASSYLESLTHMKERQVIPPATRNFLSSAYRWDA